MWAEAAARYLAELQQKHLRRTLHPLPPRVVDFASNDYLGLKNHAAMIEAARDWAAKFGAGSGASRLAGGTREEYLAIEAKLAAFKSREAALIFASGFQLNATVIPALVELQKPKIYADRLIHASLHHGIAVSGEPQIRFHHNDMNHLEDRLKADPAGPKLIVTESVFSMDGDIAPLKHLQALAEKYQALLYIDEAHATGVLGPEGRGLTSDLKDENILIMGTLGKALGGFGAYLCGETEMIDYIANRAAGFVYSTALPPACYGSIDRALDLVPKMEAERALLHQRSADLRRRLQELKIDIGAAVTQIVPAILGSEERALKAQQKLLEHHLYVPAIRPPTVPPQTARLRISLNAGQSDAAFHLLLQLLGEI